MEQNRDEQIDLLKEYLMGRYPSANEGIARTVAEGAYDSVIDTYFAQGNGVLPINSRLIGDLRFDSLDYVELVMEAEKRLDFVWTDQKVESFLDTYDNPSICQVAEEVYRIISRPVSSPRLEASL